jgi:hypothetical protein
MSTDDGCRRYRLNLFNILIYNLIKVCLIFVSLFNKIDLLVFINSTTINSIKDKLFKDGYMIEEKRKYVYLVHPVLYERK